MFRVSTPENQNVGLLRLFFSEHVGKSKFWTVAAFFRASTQKNKLLECCCFFWKVAAVLGRYDPPIGAFYESKSLSSCAP